MFLNETGSLSVEWHTIRPSHFQWNDIQLFIRLASLWWIHGLWDPAGDYTHVFNISVNPHAAGGLRVYVSISHRELHKSVTQAYIHVHVCNSTEWSKAHSDTRLVILQRRNTTPTSSHRFSLMKWNLRKVSTIAWKLLIGESHVRRLCTYIQQIWSPACVKRPVYVIQTLGDRGALGGWGVSFLTCTRDSRWLLRAFSVFHSGLPLPIMNNLQEHRCDAALAGYRSPSHKRVE